MYLRKKFIVGFLVLVAMLVVTAVWNIKELNLTGETVQSMLDENFTSIHGSRTMLEALERQDSGILLSTMGYRDKALEIVTSAKESYDLAFHTVSNNITIPGEVAYIDTIRESYAAYLQVLDQSLRKNFHEGNLGWYFEFAHGPFLQTKEAVTNLMTLNADDMFETSSKLQERVNRAVLPSVVLIISALFFSVLFNFYIHFYVVDPILRITAGVTDFMKKKTAYAVDIETHDEISELSDAIKHLCETTERK